MNAYIIAGFRSAVGKAPRGKFRFTRPDDLAAHVVNHLVSSLPGLDRTRIDDVIVGNATPEAEQGLNIGRMISLMGLNTDKVPGMTVNRYCSSGSETIAIAAAKIHSGQADMIVAGGVECMSPIPFGGWRIVPNAKVGKANPTYYWGMGLTAEAVARDFKVSREDQDAFSLRSHEKALAAISAGKFKDEIVPYTVERVYLDAKEKRQVEQYVVDTDEGPRASTLEALAKLKPVFDAKGSVTAGNASQTSDGAAFVLVVSEHMLKELGVKPIARLLSYHVAGVEPRIMGIGPVPATRKVLALAGLNLGQMDVIELNEAFAAQALAVLRELGLPDDAAHVNPNGGAIALGHPLGMSGARLVTTALCELERRGGRYGLCTMCIGAGQGIAMIIERV
jgi:acetyl-CoA acyltransferase